MRYPQSFATLVGEPDVTDGRAHIFTDGSSYIKRHPAGNVTVYGGWGAVLLYQSAKKHVIGGGRLRTGAAELTGMLEGLRQITRADCRVALYSDSQYALNCVTDWHRGWVRRGWRTATGSDVKNKEIIEALLERIAWFNTEPAWHWVKGHRGNRFNELADQLATKGRKKYGNTGGGHHVELYTTGTTRNGKASSRRAVEV